MSEKRKRRRVNPWAKGIGSLVLIAMLLFLGTYAIRFCLGLFVTGDDYILALPGETLPAASQPTEPGAEVQPTESDVVRETGRASILVTGDLMMHMPTVRSGYSGGEYNFDYIFSYIADYVKSADYAVVNLETTLSGTEKKQYTGYPKFNSPDAVAGGAKSGGFDLLLTANNHCYDYGTQGLLRTLEVVKSVGLDTLGTYSTTDEQHYLVKDLGGMKIGMLNYTYGEIGDNPSRPTVNGLPTDAAAADLINVFDYDKLDAFYSEVENQISAMKASGADVIVMFIHWGEEYSTKVSSSQKAIAQKLCDLGVHVIAGSHPHVLQTMDLLTSAADETHQTVVLYSMGNFLSNQRANNIALTTGESEDSVLFTFTVVKYSDGTVVLESVHIQPTWVLIRGSGDGRTYHILPLDYEIDNWKETFELSSSQAESARKSYNRTMDILGSDYNRVRDILQQQKAAREPEPFEPGVG